MLSTGFPNSNGQFSTESARKRFRGNVSAPHTLSVAHPIFLWCAAASPEGTHERALGHPTSSARSCGWIENANSPMPLAFSPDGMRLVFVESHPERRFDLRVRSMDANGSSEPLLATEFNERSAEISPGGDWLAYQSDASGQNEIYARPFPNVDEGRWQISRGGGTSPLWGPDGRELCYLSSVGQLTADPFTLTAA